MKQKQITEIGTGKIADGQEKHNDIAILKIKFDWGQWGP